MTFPLPTPFPQIDISSDYNPGIRLFGRRFIKEQTTVEYLAEFLALVFSDKKICDNGNKISTPLPSLDILHNWPNNNQLKYTLPVKLNLKLFSFLSSSRVDSRHDVHKDHFEVIVNKLSSKINTSMGSKEDVVDWLEQFLRGYHGAGANRTWCAQTFFPISSSLLTRETIWNVSKAKNLQTWYESIENFHTYYSISRRDFLSRGGELLYLQLCNMFTIKTSEIKAFFPQIMFNSEETDLVSLHRSLQERLAKLDGDHTASFDALVDFIDSLDRETQKLTNKTDDRLSCRWCPSDSWPEGYLFAVELNRLLGAVLDPVEKLEFLLTGCALQVLRSLCAQSMRYSRVKREGLGGALGYAWLFSHPYTPTRQQRLVSQRNLQVVQAKIQQALRINGLLENAERSPDKTKERLYREADDRYGHKLFLSLGKRMGIISPYTGPGARFIITDNLLRFLVTVIIPPGERCAYEEFLVRLYFHYGIAVEGEALINSLLWSELPANTSVQPVKGSWFAEMLRAGGFLTELSDACAIVCNTFH